MIVNDRNVANLVAAGTLACVLLLAPRAVRAADADLDAQRADRVATVTLQVANAQIVATTRAQTVGAFLLERGVVVGPADYVSPAATEILADGMAIAYRPAVAVRLSVDERVMTLTSSARDVGDLLAERRIDVRPRDVVSPGLASPLPASGFVRVRHVTEWIARVRRSEPPTVTYRSDAGLPLGRERVVDGGRPGARETTYRFVRVGGDAPARTTLATRIVREPRARVIARGIGTYASLARVAAAGFESAIHFAGSALHMIATAYTATCAGCSGMTASGVRAGFGVIAVDPRIIPLGTKLFVTGYGRAIAGDTGGAISGNRIDLGMNSIGDALQFGRRPVTVYLLR